MTIEHYLKRVSRAWRRVEMCKRRQVDLFSRATSPQPATFESGTKINANGGAYENTLAALADAGTETAKAILDYWEIRTETEMALFKLDNADEISVLFERYIEGRKVGEITAENEDRGGPTSRARINRILNNGKKHLAEILRADGVDIDVE